MQTKQFKRTVIDSIGREISYNFPPFRIISVVPSITELLFSLGLNEQIIATTVYCVHPPEAFAKAKIGGTKKISIDKVRSLKPDIILAEKSENNKENILEIAKEFPVYVFDIHNFDDAVKMIYTVGDLTNKKAEARILAEKIISKFMSLSVAENIRTVFFPVWRKPLITINGDTFINSILEFCGLKNIFADKKQNYPQIDITELKQKCPEIILLPSEPCEFNENDKKFFAEICPNSKIILVDGEMFAWYGSRMLQAADYFKECLIEN